ncbi:MAG: hypothetical protein ACOYNL_11030 [Rickettsiales bacterium]
MTNKTSHDQFDAVFKKDQEIRETARGRIREYRGLDMQGLREKHRALGNESIGKPMQDKRVIAEERRLIQKKLGPLQREYVVDKAEQLKQEYRGLSAEVLQATYETIKQSVVETSSDERKTLMTAVRRATTPIELYQSN